MGVPDKLIMEKTAGHKRLSSLHTYQAVRAKDKEAVSDILQGSKRSFLDEPETKKVKVDVSVPEPDNEKANVKTRVPERNFHVFNLSNGSVVFKIV